MLSGGQKAYLYHVTIGLKAYGGIFLPFGPQDRNGGGLPGCHQCTGGVTSCLGEEGYLGIRAIVRRIIIGLRG